MKNRKYISIAGILLAGLGLATSISNNVSAATETPLNTVLSVKYNGRGKVRLLNGAGKYQNQYVSNKQSFKVFAVATINGRTMYRLGSDKQWIPAEFTNLTPASTDSKANTASTTNAVTIKYVPGYGIAVWTSPNAGQSVIKGKVLKHNSSWKYFGTANGRDGYVWYNLGGNQWISSKYTNKPQQVANTGATSSVVTPSTTPSKGNTTSSTTKPATKPSTPAQPSKPENNNSGNKTSNSGNSGSSTTKPVTPNKPQPAFNKAEVERLLMEKISAYRMSNANPKSYSRNVFMSSPELQQLANTRLEEQKVAYGHVRPGTGTTMSVDDYNKALPDLSKQYVGGFASAGENVTSMPEGGTPEEDADILFRSWLLDSGHKQVMMMDLNTYAYGAVSVMRDGSTLVAVFEAVGR